MAILGTLRSWFGFPAGASPADGARGIRPDEFAIPYFDHIISIYQNIEYDPADPRAAGIVALIKQAQDERKGNTLTLSKVFTAEQAILRLQGLEALRGRAWDLREQYRTAFGEDQLAVHLRSAHDPALATADQLRGDLARLLDAFHWKYTFGPIREEALDGVNRRLIRVMSVFLLIVLWTVWIDYRYSGQTRQTVSLIPLVMFAGASGAAISLQNRLQRVPTTGDSIISLFALKHGRASLSLAPITGALFALLAYLLFVSGLVKGDLFPKIRVVEAARPAAWHFGTFGGFLSSMSPTSALDFAKLLIFCFVAGFAERLIPDVLDRMVTKNVNNLTDRMLTADSLKDMLSGLMSRASQEKAAAEAEETRKRKEAEERAAGEKADAETRATEKKKEIDTEAAGAKTGADEPGKEDIEKRAAAARAAVEAEATRVKKESELRAAGANADAAAEATRRKKEADDRAHEPPTGPTPADPVTPPLESREPTEAAGPTPPPHEGPGAP